MEVAVTSPSFSSNKILQKEIYKYFPHAKLNTDGKRFNKKELIEYIRDVEALIVGLEVVDDEVLQECRKIKIISKYGVGLNNLDLDACERRNIVIGWSGGVNRLSVAEMTLGYMLMLCRNLFVTSNQLKSGVWNKSGGFQLSGKKVGIIGVGHIGKELIRLLEPFNCEVWVNDIIDQEKYYKENNLLEKSKEEIFSSCDIVSIHTPLDSSTENLVTLDVIKTMKRSSLLINSARGGIIDENGLKVALMGGLIAGAAIDAYTEEPPMDKELLSLPNLVCTPHIGGNSKEAVEAMGMSAINHLREFYSL